MKKTAIALLCSLVGIGISASEALWMRDVKISPDGTRIAFAYKGDIFTVPATGGMATRLTTQSSYESTPVWSPDSRQIAFASDRNGNFDVYIMSADGGTPTRLTRNQASEIPEAFSPDGKLIYYSAAIQNPTASAIFPSARMTEFYSVPVGGGASLQVLGTPAQMPTFSTDGNTMLYQDVKGFEDEWRKHHTSSVTRDIWKLDIPTGKHTNLTNRPGEDRNPILDNKTNAVYFLSERNGDTFNVWTFPLDAPDKAERITDFSKHPVRFLSRSDDGTMAFTYDGAIYTLRDGGKPERLQVKAVTDDSVDVTRRSVRPGMGVASPDGKMIAFTDRGDVFVTAVEYPTTYQVTHTPAAERHVSWGADNRTLYYTSERSGRKNIYKAEMTRKDDPNFANATAVKETPLFEVNTPANIAEVTDEYSHPVVSPDGKKLAFVKNRNNIMVMDIASKKVTQLTHGETYPDFNDGMSFEWSPDSRWLTMEIIPDMRDPYSDVGLIEVATGKVYNLTNSGYFEGNPHFVLGGNAIIYYTDRYGMRAHASWGSLNDVMIVFLNREARDRFMLNEEDFTLLTDAEKAEKSKSSDKPASSDKNKKSKNKDKATKGKPDETDKPAQADKGAKPIVVEFDDIESRTMRLTPFSSDLADFAVAEDGKTLYFFSSVDDGYDLWKMPLRKREPKLASKMGSNRPPVLQADKDGKTLFVFGDKMQKLDPKTDKLKAISATATHELDLAAEREAMFDYMTVEESARFYTPSMHGINWPEMTNDYRKFLPHINNNYDYAEMLSELLGELNVSHTGGRYRPMGVNTQADRTASLGLLYDMSFTGNGVKVDEVIVNGPFDNAKSKMVPGSIITAVNSQPLDENSDLSALLLNLTGKKTLVTFETPAGVQVEEVVKPIFTAKENGLLYNRWVKQRAADVERWSNGRLGYVHIPSMADEAFRPMYADLLGKYAKADGVVIDIRWNGGGRMHEDIEVLFTGEKYLTQEVRGKDVCDMPSRRWNKPSIMLVAEPCYSNAHGTPWVYQHQKIGKVVGAPVPGTMTSVNWVTMQDPSLVFGIPVIGYRTAEGNYLENTQLEPDIKVYNTPETIVKGEDIQLRTAVETLLRDIDATKK